MASRKGPRVDPFTKYDVYALADPESGQICYIGISYDPPKRLRQHMREAKRNKTLKERWLHGLSEAPALVILEEQLTRPWALIAEQKWIRHGDDLGWPLMNAVRRKRR